MDEILADYNEAELELLAGFLQKVTAAGVIAAALSDRGDAVASGTASADRTACPPTLHSNRAPSRHYTDAGGAGRTSRPRKRCPTSYSPTPLRSVGNASASAAATSGLPNRSNRRFRPCESCAARSSMPLTVRFRTVSAMTPSAKKEGEGNGARAPAVNENALLERITAAGEER
jgi:hypothetical protein